MGETMNPIDLQKMYDVYAVAYRQAILDKKQTVEKLCLGSLIFLDQELKEEKENVPRKNKI